MDVESVAELALIEQCQRPSDRQAFAHEPSEPEKGISSVIVRAVAVAQVR
jgi:hypothetical protein